MAEWDADFAIDMDRATSLIKEVTPAVQLRSITPYSEGWDNTAFLVEAEGETRPIVFRFPRRKIAIPFMDQEIRILARLGPELPLPIPNPQWIGEATAAYPMRYAGYSLLAGNTLDRAFLHDEDHAALAAPLGSFLATLHGLTPLAAELGVEPDAFRANIARSRGRTQKRQQSIAATYPEEGQLITRLLAATASIEANEDDLVLSHGDFYARHLLVDASSKLCGVIDWGDLCIGDRAIDLMVAHELLPPAAHPDFLSAYGPVSEAAWERARFNALSSATALLIYGDDIQDEALIKSAQRGLRYLAASL